MKYIKGTFANTPQVLVALLEQSDYVYISLVGRRVDKCTYTEFTEEYEGENGEAIDLKMLYRLGVSEIQVRRKRVVMVAAGYNKEDWRWEVQNSNRKISVDAETFFKYYVTVNMRNKVVELDDIRSKPVGGSYILSFRYFTPSGAYESPQIKEGITQEGFEYYLGTKFLFKRVFEEKPFTMGELAKQIKEDFRADGMVMKFIEFRAREKKTGRITEFQV